MTHQQSDNDELDDDMEGLEADTELDAFLDTMTSEDKQQNSAITARKKLEDLNEEKRLRSLLEDYYDDDEDE